MGVSILAVVSSVATLLSSAGGVAESPDCKGQLLASFDRQNGAFDAMSHSGALLVIDNPGPSSCRTPGLPALEMQDASGGALAFIRQAPPGMHPGPVIVPIVLTPGGRATTTLTWVSGPVYDHSDCVTPARIAVTLGSDKQILPWPGGQVCGPAGKPIAYREPILTNGPAATP